MISQWHAYSGVAWQEISRLIVDNVLNTFSETPLPARVATQEQSSGTSLGRLCPAPGGAIHLFRSHFYHFGSVY